MIKLPIRSPFSTPLTNYRSLSVPPHWRVAWGNADGFDEEATWRDRHFAIYNAQPAFSPDRRFVVVGDIWLSDVADNPQEFVAQLWQGFGADTLQTLTGTFALAVWDRETQQLWLGRDRVGARTLYYTTVGSTRWIAPRLKNLARYHSRELDLVALRDYLCCAFVPGERTLWREVRELRPGNYLCFKEELKSPSPSVYWQPQEQIQNADKSIQWHGQKLRSLLDQIVTEYLPENEPAGAYLSGGLDSSCIVALAAKFHGQPINTYSIHFGAQLPNELEFSTAVAEHCQTKHHILEITADEMWEKLPVAMANLDEPIGDPLTVPNYLLGQLARENCRVILNGEGGDPCFGGPKNKPMLLNNIYGSLGGSPPDLLSSYLGSFQKCFADLPQLLKPDIWESIKTEKSVFAPDLTADINYLNRLMLLNIKFKGADHILTKVNNLTRAANLEGRSPLFDQRIVELSLQIPPQYKLSGADEKAVLKSAVWDLLPEAIITRPKSGMMVPVNYWFRENWQQQTRRLLLNKKAAIAPYLNQKLIKEWSNYRGDTWNRYGIKLWLLVSLEIWLQINSNS